MIRKWSVGVDGGLRALSLALGGVLLAGGAFASGTAVSAPVAACSCVGGAGPQSPMPRWPYPFERSRVASNGLFVGTSEWRDVAGVRLELASDVDASRELGTAVRRSLRTLAPGDRFFLADANCPTSGECRYGFEVAPADTTPPAAPELIDARVHFVVDAPENPSGCVSDAIELSLRGGDDTTPADELGVLAFVGATPEEAQALAQPSISFGLEEGRGDEPHRVLIRLGGVGGRGRDESPFRQAGPFCFALALADASGNVGPRSAPSCIDTTNPDAEGVVRVAYSAPCTGLFCSVSTGTRQPGPFTWLLAFAAFGVSGARRYRRGRSHRA